MNTTLTAVPGIRVGHAQHDSAVTGCTAIIGPFRAAVSVAGFATGSRELHTLDPSHLVERTDAILLCGGSAFGLDAASGAMKWLHQNGFGFDTGVTRVPIVPAAVIFDITSTDPIQHPNEHTGFAACAAASTAVVREGKVGAGVGATIGKIMGRAGVTRGGIGSVALHWNDYTVGALVVVNAFGDVTDMDGRIIAGAMHDGAFVDTAKVLREGRKDASFARAHTNTTLAVIATDAPLTRIALQFLARSASNAMARRIQPVFTPFDGDIVFAASTAAGDAKEFDAADRMSIGVVAQHALELAIVRAAIVSAEVSGTGTTGGTVSG